MSIESTGSGPSDSASGSGRRQENNHRAPNSAGSGGHRQSHNGYSGKPYAALDLGTNNCRLLIAEPLRRSFRVIDAFSRIVRLGEGVSLTGALSQDAMDRAVGALKVCRDKIKSRNVGRARMIATEACRIAENGAEFLDRVRSETGLDLEIVDRETEARLAVSGSASLIDRNADGVLIFDIGGGSTELVWLDMREQRGRSPLSAHNRIAGWTSLPLGVVKLAETFGGVDVTPEVFEAMVDETSRHLHDFSAGQAASDAINGDANVHLLGTSGTVTTLAGVLLGLRRYDRRKVDGSWLMRDHMRQITMDMVGWPYEKRRSNGCIGPERADLVLPGCAILEAILRTWPCERLRVADRGLREGMLTMLMAEDGVWRRPNDRPRRRRRRRRRRGGKGGHIAMAPQGGNA